MLQQVSRQSSTVEVLDWIKHVHLADASVERVGAWVWVKFPQKPVETVRKTLSGAGFHWNGKRGVWQHPCGKFSRRSKGDPHDTYDSENVEV